jgi:hypothetical protein
MLLTDESGATTTEYSLIAAGVGFAVTLTVLPPSIALARPIAALALLLALRRRNGGRSGRVEDGHGRLALANAMAATPLRIRARSQSLDAGAITASDRMAVGYWSVFGTSSRVRRLITRRPPG